MLQIFSNGDGYNDLWYITWNNIGEFLPTLKEELFPQGNYYYLAQAGIDVEAVRPAVGRLKYVVSGHEYRLATR